MRNRIITAVAGAAALLSASQLLAVITVIEGFENNADPGGWQQVSPAPQTNNATNVAVPNYIATSVTEGVLAGEFPVNWLGAAAGATNPYFTSGTLNFWSMRNNIATATALSTIPNSNAIFYADVFNPSTTDTVQIAFYVIDNGGTGGLERGPFISLPPNATTTYTWTMGVDPVVSFITGNSVLDGTTSRLRGFFIYTETAPTTTPLNIAVDNIRVDAQSDLTAPAAPKILSAKQGPNPGELVVRWVAGSEPDLAGYKVYLADDTNFGTPIANRFGFPSTPSATVMNPAATTTTLTGVPTDQNVYVRVTAIDNATPVTNESFSDIVLGARLAASGAAPQDLVVLDYDRYTAADANFTVNGYYHGIAYWGKALHANTRTYASARAAAVDSAAVTLSSYPGIVYWATQRDGELVTDQTLTTASETAISGFLTGGGNLLISGTSLGKDLTTNGDAGDQAFYSGTLKATLSNENAANGDLNADANFPTAGAFSTQPNQFDVAAGTETNNEVIGATGSGVGALAYAVAGGSGAVLDNNALIYMSFAFETVRDTAVPNGITEAAAKRAALLADSIAYLEALPPSQAENNWSMYE